MAVVSVAAIGAGVTIRTLASIVRDRNSRGMTAMATRVFVGLMVVVVVVVVV